MALAGLQRILTRMDIVFSKHLWGLCVPLSAYKCLSAGHVHADDFILHGFLHMFWQEYLYAFIYNFFLNSNASS